MRRGVKLDGETLRRLRKARMLSQAQLGEKAGVTTATVNRIENGHPASFSTAESLAKVLGLDADWLLEETAADILVGNGSSERKAAVVDLSDGAGTALMERVATGETEEVRELEDRYIEFLPRYAAERGDRDMVFTVEAFEQDLALALAALAAEDRNEGAEAIRRALERIREIAESGG